MRLILTTILSALFLGVTFLRAQTKIVFQEKNGIVAFEAGHFTEHKKDEIRKWYVQHDFATQKVTPDHDQIHFKDARKETYIEILPDTRVGESDPLQGGVIFSDTPGVLCS